MDIRIHHHESQELREVHITVIPYGILGLQKMHTRIKAIEKAMVEEIERLAIDAVEKETVEEVDMLAM